MQALGFLFVVLKWLFGQRRCLGRFACCILPLGGIVITILGVILFLLFMMRGSEEEEE
jgi:hypothetical protein